jgi:23S rRNA pseudouridine1911/1915/1917 synthase
MEPLFEIIEETADFLAINKPAGLVCHPTKGDRLSSLVSRVRVHYERANQPVSVHIVNRLDRETSGVTLVAKNSSAAGELGRLWEARRVRKIYFAIVHGDVAADSGVVEAPLGRDESSVVAVKDCVRADGAAAATHFRVLARFTAQDRRFSLVELEPQTGRKHQLRLHMASLGHPIVGDKLYGGREDDYLALVENRLDDEARRRLILPWQALHAGSLGFAWRARDWVFTASPEAWFLDFLPASLAEAVWPGAVDRARGGAGYLGLSKA